MSDPDLFGRQPNGASDLIGMQQDRPPPLVPETTAQAAKRHFDSLFLILSVERDNAMRDRNQMKARECAITVTELETAQLWCNHIFKDG